MKLGQNFVKYSVRILGTGVSRKNVFKMYWPFKSRVSRTFKELITWFNRTVYCSKLVLNSYSWNHIIDLLTYLGLVEEKMGGSDQATISEMNPWGNVWCNQSYEIKLPPRPILGFKILEINARLSIGPNLNFATS